MSLFRAAKHRLVVSAYDRWLREELAEEIAEAIMLNVIGPAAYCFNKYCPCHVRFAEAQVAADIARAIGSGRHPTGIQAAQPGCVPSAVQPWPVSEAPGESVP